MKQLTGAGISSILTADERRCTQIKVNTDLNSDYTTERQYNQICLEYLRSSAFICGLNNFINYVFQQPWRYPTTPRCHRPHHRAPARRLSQCLAGTGALCIAHRKRSEGRREIKATNMGWNQFNTNHRGHRDKQKHSVHSVSSVVQNTT